MPRTSLGNLYALVLWNQPGSTRQKCSFSVVSELQRTILQWLFWIYLTHWCSNSDVFLIAWACQVLIVRCSYWWVLHFWLGLLMFLVDSPSISKLSFEENGKSLRSPGRLLFKSFGWNKSLFRGRVNGMWRAYYTLHMFFFVQRLGWEDVVTFLRR